MIEELSRWDYTAAHQQLPFTALLLNTGHISEIVVPLGCLDTRIIVRVLTNVFRVWKIWEIVI